MLVLQRADVKCQAKLLKLSPFSLQRFLRVNFHITKALQKRDILLLAYLSCILIQVATYVIFIH